MKPFNEEAAKAGAPVCTRDGRDARILCFDKRADRPIVALIDCGHFERVLSMLGDGNLCVGSASGHDLFMRPTKREGWVNVYSDGTTGQVIYGSETAAEQRAGRSVVATVKIEWEE